MIEEILNASGVPNQESDFSDPPEVTYAVYFDEITADGPDPVGENAPQVERHDATVELYEPSKDAAKESAIEAELKARGISWHKQSRYWLESIQRYQVIYEFTYFLKS